MGSVFKSFFSQPSSILILSEKKATYGRKGKEIHTFSQPEEFLSFYGHQKPKENLIVILDRGEVTYQLELLPKLTYWDRHNLVKRRLEKIMGKCFLKGSHLFSQQAVGLAGVTLSSSLKAWVEALETVKSPLHRLTFLPLELVGFLPKTSWALVVYQNQTGIYGHALFHNNQLLFMRLTHKSTPVQEDIDSTLKYSQRFQLPSRGGEILLWGKFSPLLPSTIMGLPVRSLFPTQSLEEFLITQSPGFTWRRFSFQTRGTSLWSSKLAYEIASWLRKLGMGYGIGALFISFYFILMGLFLQEKAEERIKKLEYLKAHLSYFHKTYPDGMENAPLYIAYERYRKATPDPLSVLEIIARQKPPHLMATSLMWQHSPTDSPRLAIQFTCTDQGKSSKGVAQESKTLIQALSDALPLYDVTASSNLEENPIVILSTHKENSEDEETPEPMLTCRLTYKGNAP